MIKPNIDELTPKLLAEAMHKLGTDWEGKTYPCEVIPISSNTPMGDVLHDYGTELVETELDADKNEVTYTFRSTDDIDGETTEIIITLRVVGACAEVTPWEEDD